MYFHALNLPFMLHHHPVYERGRPSQTMIPNPGLAIRKSFHYFACCFTFSSYTQKSQKKYWLLIPFYFVNLQAKGA
jgi:hypothetical protein